MGKATGLSLGPQNAVGDMMSCHLAALNLPSCTDIAALGERSAGNQGTLDRLTDAIEQSRIDMGTVSVQRSSCFASCNGEALWRGQASEVCARGSHGL